jgi:hypothetical protein
MMNEKINAIAEDCGLYIAYENKAVTQKEIEFFAEQIIKECARIDSQENNVDHVDGETYNHTILDHFGVKVK